MSAARKRSPTIATVKRTIRRTAIGWTVVETDEEADGGEPSSSSSVSSSLVSGAICRSVPVTGWALPADAVDRVTRLRDGYALRRS